MLITPAQPVWQLRRRLERSVFQAHYISHQSTSHQCRVTIAEREKVPKTPGRDCRNAAGGKSNLVVSINSRGQLLQKSFLFLLEAQKRCQFAIHAIEPGFEPIHRFQEDGRT